MAKNKGNDYEIPLEKHDTGTSTDENDVSTEIDTKLNEDSNKKNGIAKTIDEKHDTGTSSYENAAFVKDIETDLDEDSTKKNGTAKTIDDDTYAKVIDPPKKSNGDATVIDPDNDDDDDLQARLWKGIYVYTDSITKTLSENKTMIRYMVLIILLMGYAAFLIYACIYDFDEAFVILIITGLVVFVYGYILIRDTQGEKIYKKIMIPIGEKIDKSWVYIKWPCILAVIAGIGVALYFLTRDTPENLISLAGLAFFLLFSYVFSKYPAQVKWRPVIWGLALQMLLGLFILRTYPGFVLFEWLSDVVYAFLNFSAAGAIFLFGENYQEHYFAFAVLPIIIYFSAVISVLYYWGVMQTVIQKVAWLMQRTMRTSASESLNAAGNIFVGMTEAPLLIKPYLKDMTRSEIHAVMTGGFATVAGSTLGAYILYGIDATHLITASVMSAPAALAMSKLFYPETEKSKHLTEEDMVLAKGDELNVIEAAANGASQAIPLVLNVAANLIAFLSLLALVNALLGYFGGLVGYPQLTFEFICSYVFVPIAFIMGVEWADCRVVAELIGLKTFVNEFYAYEVLGKYIENRTTGAGPTLSVRSEVIATYALCGFANIGSVGIVLGALGPMAPSRKGDLAAVAIRALIAGTVACFMTACIAGILYVPEDIPFNNSTTSIPPMTTVY
ncbi:solute carrier family 28 member 3 [Strongylocentrotus purpuratus]|uniref:Sodium/nucleoside cotransporter n=1 Tax=Strongylocentrotus purpuratus TaxID=7668 RepID=A0A7M7NZ01_STRPU|nr:solute carrier family 28 member 3 [Strongylocentrotus purpuratus]